MNNKIFRITLLFVFFAELISLCVFLLPELMPLAFLTVIILTLVISLNRLEYGLLILFAELFIGSKGYLFFIQIGGISVSIRIALWLIIMSAWLLGFLKGLNAKKFKLNITSIKNTFLPYFMFLFLFVGWGLANGFLNHNSFDNIFFDFNGWLYFVLIFPVYTVIFQNNDSLKNIYSVFMASIIWLSVKTYFLLFIFSHNMIGMIEELYRWVRTTGVGEITNFQGGFYRIFFQSHIYALFGFFMLLLLLLYKNEYTQNKLKIKHTAIFYLLASLFLSVVILSFSRSNWIGLVFGLAIIIVYLLFRKEWKKILITAGILATTFALSLVLIVVTVKFPYPSPTGGFSATELLSNRASQLAGEAALSSRWTLLPELWAKIKMAPVLGSGFGSTITYISSDPRILENDPTGRFTTFAFEWGWLDIWIKMGILGIAAYIGLIFKIFTIGISDNLKAGKHLLVAASACLAALSIISFFSPYLNHPLGIGFVMLVAAAIDKGRLAPRNAPEGR